MTRYRNQSSGLSRRKLLKTTAGLGAGAALSGLLPSCRRVPPTRP
jgi:TAT (twin-arginine translocation) pathway signal sequence.